MDRWQDLIVRTIREGIANGELDPELGPEAVATVVISTIEGAVSHLTRYLGSLLR